MQNQAGATAPSQITNARSTDAASVTRQRWPRRIHEAAIRPSLIISSPAVRAWTTAKAVAREISYPIEFLQREKDLYLASLSTLIDVVGEQDNGFNSLMVVGHNPGLTEFANYLVPGLTGNLPTAGVVSVAIDADSWDLHNLPEVTLNLHDYPKKAH